MELERGTVWKDKGALPSHAYTCGYCGNPLASAAGYQAMYQGEAKARIYICHFCRRPTYFGRAGEQIPGTAPGNEVSDIDDESVRDLYTEARNAAGANCPTASVLCSRKLLMNIAVDQKAKKNESFAFYVDYLAENHFIPPGAKVWVDHIRKTGNEANHEINLMKKEDAEELLSFLEMLLKMIYEFPATAKKKYPVKEPAEKPDEKKAA